jgi:hypothetical protein
MQACCQATPRADRSRAGGRWPGSIHSFGEAAPERVRCTELRLRRGRTPRPTRSAEVAQPAAAGCRPSAFGRSPPAVDRQHRRQTRGCTNLLRRPTRSEMTPVSFVRKRSQQPDGKSPRDVSDRPTRRLAYRYPRQACSAPTGSIAVAPTGVATRARRDPCERPGKRSAAGSRGACQRLLAEHMHHDRPAVRGAPVLPHV